MNKIDQKVRLETKQMEYMTKIIDLTEKALFGEVITGKNRKPTNDQNDTGEPNGLRGDGNGNRETT